VLCLSVCFSFFPHSLAFLFRFVVSLLHAKPCLDQCLVKAPCRHWEWASCTSPSSAGAPPPTHPTLALPLPLPVALPTPLPPAVPLPVSVCSGSPPSWCWRCARAGPRHGRPVRPLHRCSERTTRGSTLRFFQTRGDPGNRGQLKGDPSDDFAFATLLPEPMRCFLQ